jgi:hypothetical protein
MVRRLKQMQSGDVLLFAEATRLRLFPPLRAAWARRGQQAVGPVSGRKDRRVLFGAFHPRTAQRIVVQSERETGPGARALLAEWRRRYRAAPTIWVLLDRGPAHTAAPTQPLAAQLNMQLIWLPQQWPELNAMDQLWRELKRLVAVNRQPESVEHLAQPAESWLLELSPQEALRKAGVLSGKFWLKHWLQ